MINLVVSLYFIASRMQFAHTHATNTQYLMVDVNEIPELKTTVYEFGRTNICAESCALHCKLLQIYEENYHV